MAILKGKGRQSTAIARESEGAEVFLRALRDGSMITSDWKEAAIMGGFGYCVKLGAFTAGATGGGVGTTLDLEEPELRIGIPSGTSILPISVLATIKPGTWVDEDEYEILVAVDQDNYGGQTTAGASSAGVAHNLNTLCGKTSSCIVTTQHTSTMVAAPALDLELAHTLVIADGSGTEADFDFSDVRMDYEPKNPPIINGPAAFYVYFGGDDVVTGYLAVSWLEFPSTAFKV